LASISPALSADAKKILSFLPPDVWAIPVHQMSSMAEIISAVNDEGEFPLPVAHAALELLRRRTTWLPRWTLLSLALVCLASRRWARAVFEWMTTPA